MKAKIASQNKNIANLTDIWKLAYARYRSYESFA
jgi:hypothetical protein